MNVNHLTQIEDHLSRAIERLDAGIEADPDAPGIVSAFNQTTQALFLVQMSLHGTPRAEEGARLRRRSFGEAQMAGRGRGES